MEVWNKVREREEVVKEIEQKVGKTCRNRL